MIEEGTKPRIVFARNVARKIIADLKIENPPILIGNIIAHLKKSHNLSVYSWALGDNVDGIQITQGDVSAIAYNGAKHSHRQRFTVAHEIGHLLMGHTREAPMDLYSDKPENIEANQFAAELLMPLHMLKNDFQGDEKDIVLLAKRYFVSEEAMWRRLLECKFLSKYKLHNN